MSTTKLSTCIREAVARINSVRGDQLATYDVETPDKEPRIYVGLGGLEEFEPRTTPLERARTRLYLSIRTSLLVRGKGDPSLALLDMHESALNALKGWTPSVADFLNLGGTRQVLSQVGVKVYSSIETQAEVSIELEGVE